jgi:hypothetical protein
MLEKLLLAVTLTFSLNMFLGFSNYSDPSTAVSKNLQATPSLTVSQLSTEN